MLTTDNYECTWGLFKSIPSLRDPRKSVFAETVEFNERNKSHSRARLVDGNRAIVDVSSMGFTMSDRLELVRIAEASEERLGASRITDWLSPPFFTTKFWYMWQTTFAFQPWHSAVEFKRYLHRFMKEFRPHRNARRRQANGLQPVRFAGPPAAELARAAGRQGPQRLQRDGSRRLEASTANWPPPP